MLARRVVMFDFVVDRLGYSGVVGVDDVFGVEWGSIAVLTWLLM